MYRNCNKHYLLWIFFCCIGFTSLAQKSNRENSPYSRFGIGEFRNAVNTNLRGMGSVSSAYSNEYSVNTDNPASYADLKLTTYEAAMEGSKRTLFSNGNVYSTGTATLSYLTIGIPVSKHVGLALGLRPYTRVYYNSEDSINMPGLGPSIRGYYGDGGTNFAFLGLAGKIKGFSAGINFGYLFGTINYRSSLSKQYDTANYFNSAFSKFTRIGDIYYKGGVMYQTDITKKLSLRVGGTFATRQNVNATKSEYQVIFNDYVNSSAIDTAVKNEDVKGAITLPSTYTLGIQLYNTGKWAAGIDFSTSKWSDYREFGSRDSVADRTMKVAVGGEYTPNATSIYKYLSRITYRLGFYYGKDYIELHNTAINYYAVTLGASLPFKRSYDRVHVALELGKRGTESNGLIRENFFKFTVGMSLNDKWFVKRKYD